MGHFKDRYESLRVLVEGIAVDSLAVFELETCREDELIDAVLKRMDQLDIDQMPVEPHRTHYVVREDLKQLDPGSSIHLAPHVALAPPVLVAAGTSLSEVYPLFQEREFLFVLQGTEVQGIVTRGDFQRAPFRVYLFGLLSLFEMGVTDLVLEVYGDEDWQTLPEAQDAVAEARHWYDRVKKRGEEPLSRFEVVSLAKKLVVLKNAERAMQRFGEDERQWISEMDTDRVKTLRNNLAHAKDLTSGLQPERWESVYELTDHFERLTGAILSIDR
jgi:CBS domain-containing protein